MTGIYKITNPKGKIYIGQSIDIYSRIKYYKNLNCKKQRKLYNSLLKYGWDNHKFEIVSLCYEEQLNEFERDFQEAYNVIGENGLNLRLTETFDRNGKLSEELKNKISNSLKKSKRIYKPLSEETKLKMSITLNKRRHDKEIILGLNSRKKVINLQTNIIYDSAKTVANEFNMSYNYLMKRLSGIQTNNTQFKYYTI